jgi:hypothetical protein
MKISGGSNHTSAGVFNRGSYDPKGIEMFCCSEKANSGLDSTNVQIVISKNKIIFMYFFTIVCINYIVQIFIA